MIEPRAELGRGEAYSAVELGHTLNGNAARMSVDPDNPDDLTQWLTALHCRRWLAGVGPSSMCRSVNCSARADCSACTCSSVWPKRRRSGALNGSAVEHVRAEVVDLQAACRLGAA